jgi:molybdopterin-guanine dinucleotide biosynthesis protein
MNLVVVGGHSRNIGKTSVMAELIRAITPPRWVAVKITQYGHGICSLDGKPCACEPEEHGFVLNEEKDSAGRADTCRFLAAGAKRSLWLRARQGQLAAALPTLHRALRGEDWVMIESNSILGFFKPALYLFVLDPSRQDFKASARNYLERADALIALDFRAGPNPWPGVADTLLTEKPSFAVSREDYRSRELSDFVREKLGLNEEVGFPSRQG